ncbi:MAG: S8 family serine peptidase [Deltaproteobacteria bacterium]|nr:S8 family serine peptidase [Deltaproteobacteria bacterium]
MLFAFACTKGGSAGSSVVCNSDAGDVASGGTCIPATYAEADMQPLTNATLDTDADAGITYVRGQLIVALKDAGTSRNSAVAFFAARGGTVNGSHPQAGIYRVSFPAATTSALLSAAQSTLASDPAVEFSIRDALDVDVTDATDASVRPPDRDLDLLYFQYLLTGKTGNLWAYTKTQIYEAWDAIYAANPYLTKVVVGVIDTYVEKSPTFSTLPFAGATDFRQGFGFDTSTTPTHGTNVASVIGAPSDARGMNGILAGLACVNYDLAPMAAIAKFNAAQDAGVGSVFSTKLGAIIAAVKAGARVVNMSYGGYATGSEFDYRLRLYRAQFQLAPRVLFVAAAGNENRDTALHLPAAVAASGYRYDGGQVPNIMSVAATDKNDLRSTWSGGGGSNYLANPADHAVTIAAPGSDVLVTEPNGDLILNDGTSFAAPMVSGVAALLFAIDPDLTGKQVRDILVDAGDAIAVDAMPDRRLNAKRAVDLVLAAVPTVRRGAGNCRAPDEVDSGSTPTGEGIDCLFPPKKTCTYCVSSAALNLSLPWLSPLTSVAVNNAKGTIKFWPTSNYYPMDMSLQSPQSVVPTGNVSWVAQKSSWSSTTTSVVDNEPSVTTTFQFCATASGDAGTFQSCGDIKSANFSANLSADGKSVTASLSFTGTKSALVAYDNADAGSGSGNTTFTGTLAPDSGVCP